MPYPHCQILRTGLHWPVLAMIQTLFGVRVSRPVLCTGCALCRPKMVEVKFALTGAWAHTGEVNVFFGLEALVCIDLMLPLGKDPKYLRAVTLAGAEAADGGHCQVSLLPQVLPHAGAAQRAAGPGRRGPGGLPGRLEALYDKCATVALAVAAGGGRGHGRQG